MILLAILTFVLIVMTVVSLVFGGAFFLVFGDLIVFGLIVGGIVRLLVNKNKKAKGA